MLKKCWLLEPDLYQAEIDVDGNVKEKGFVGMINAFWKEHYP